MLRLRPTKRSRMGARLEAPADLEAQKPTPNLSEESPSTSDDDHSLEVPNNKRPATRVWLTMIFVFLVGVAASAAMLGHDIPASVEDQQRKFLRVADDFVLRLEAAMDRYMVAGLWIHQACRERTITHAQFRILYEYLVSSGLHFQAASFIMNVTDAERGGMEAEARAYMAEHFPQSNYQGFVGWQGNETTGEPTVGPRPWNQSQYYPMQFVEPLEEYWNQIFMGYDMLTSPSLQGPFFMALQTGQPAMTQRLALLPAIEGEPYAYSIALYHPGAPIPSLVDEQPRDLALLMLKIPELLILSYANAQVEECVDVYLFDSTDHTKPAFLGGSMVHSEYLGEEGLLFHQETTMEELKAKKRLFRVERTIEVAQREWTLVILTTPYSFQPETTFLIVAAAMIFLACVGLALWIWTSSKRAAKINEVQAQAEAEKAAIIVENAKSSAKQERELNDFIAHEVRNPLAAAISACSFVSSLVHEEKPLVTAESRQCVREDVGIIDNSLQFINDLLRNMLDMHRASSRQMKIDSKHVDLLQDVLRPVASMIYKRGDNFEVLVDCPEHVVILSDGLRLKQVMLNLGRNAAKFVTTGFVRLRVETIEGRVFLFVEDSGPGIPIAKRDKLFAKFQDSLDSLNQGTGIGLCLCQHLIELMGGEITLDESYHSGVEGMPGARFVINLNTAPVEWTPDESTTSLERDDTHLVEAQRLNSVMQLPDHVSVLFVDDSFVLRKLFGRSIKKLAPDWTVQEAGNGETALRMVETESFDLIFVDQYMASTDRQLLGTETVRALRAKGVKSIIVGLSANDLAKPFVDAGADSFMTKPFPCEKDAMATTLLDILHGKDQNAGDKCAFGDL